MLQGLRRIFSSLLYALARSAVKIVRQPRSRRSLNNIHKILVYYHDETSTKAIKLENYWINLSALRIGKILEKHYGNYVDIVIEHEPKKNLHVERYLKQDEFVSSIASSSNL